jgi:amidase
LNTLSLHDALPIYALLDRVSALNGPDGPIALHAVAAIAHDALEVARQRDSERANGTIRGPLHGVPVLIKDNIEATGLPGTAGATALIGRPAHDAELVTRLRDAGAIVLGSTNLSQWANLRSNKSASGYSATGGLVGNPWSLDRSAGGSSSGSGAAAAAAFAPLVVGTETDGSITCPASLNGVVGLKPTVGNVSRHGVVPISHVQDSPGPLTRTVADARLLYAVLSGTTPPATTTSRLVRATTWKTGHLATDKVFADFLTAARNAGLEVPDREFAVFGKEQGNDEQHALLCEFYDDLSAYLAARPGEGVKSLEDVIDFENQHAELEHRYSSHEHFLAARATGGMSNPTYRECRDRVVSWAINDCLEPGLGDDDIVTSPAYAPAWKSDLVLGDLGIWFNSGISAAAVSGWPIVTVPIGLVMGLPVGMTLIGRPHSEYALLDAAATFEEVARSRGWTGLPHWRHQRGL